MRVKLGLLFLMTVVFLWTGGALMSANGTEETPRMTKEDLKARLGDADVVILDVRAGNSWTDSASKIKGAVREDPADVGNWMKNYPKGKTLVFYCS